MGLILRNRDGYKYKSGRKTYVFEKDVPVYDNVELWLVAAHALSYCNK